VLYCEANKYSLSLSAIAVLLVIDGLEVLCFRVVRPSVHACERRHSPTCSPSTASFNLSGMANSPSNEFGMQVSILLSTLSLTFTDTIHFTMLDSGVG